MSATFKWIAATAEFQGLGERTPIPNHPEVVSARKTSKVMCSYHQNSEATGSGGHAGNDLWWDDPKEVFTITGHNKHGRLSKYEAVQLARWILSVADAACDGCKDKP